MGQLCLTKGWQTVPLYLLAQTWHLINICWKLGIQRKFSERSPEELTKKMLQYTPSRQTGNCLPAINPNLKNEIPCDRICFTRMIFLYRFCFVNRNNLFFSFFPFSISLLSLWTSYFPIIFHPVVLTFIDNLSLKNKLLPWWFKNSGFLMISFLLYLLDAVFL